jgi:tetratricopeptide (TPR) repeat protein
MPCRNPANGWRSAQERHGQNEVMPGVGAMISAVYKGRPTDVRQVGRALGARYVLEGSVRRAGDKLRITGLLIDSSTGVHLWADRFDGGREDIFDLQDQVTATVAGAIASELEQAEIIRSRRKPTESLDAYDFYLRGVAALHLWTIQGSNEALSLLARAIALDANFASAFGMAARCYSQRMGSRWMADRPREVAEAERLAQRAVELGQDDAVALSTAGLALAYVVGDFETGAALIERALSLNPNLSWASSFRGFVKAWLGQPDVAIEHVERALRLSPNDPHVYAMRTHIAFGHFVAGRIAEALTWSELTSRERPRPPFQHSHLGRVVCNRRSPSRSGEDRGSLASALSRVAAL